MGRLSGTVLVLFCLGISYAGADSIRTMGLHPAINGQAHAKETRIRPVFSPAWKLSGNLPTAGVARHNVRFCGRACSPRGSSVVRVPGTAAVRGVAPANSRKADGILGWIVNFVRR